MWKTKKQAPRLHSKRGVTMVEVLVAVLVVAVVTVGAFTAFSAAQATVYQSGSQQKAAGEAQSLAETLAQKLAPATSSHPQLVVPSDPENNMQLTLDSAYSNVQYDQVKAGQAFPNDSKADHQFRVTKVGTDTVGYTFQNKGETTVSRPVASATSGTLTVYKIEVAVRYTDKGKSQYVQLTDYATRASS